jgi:hypothetical protein
VRVPIDARATRSLGIIEVNRREPVATNDTIEFMKCFLNRNLRANVVAGSRNVSGIEANAEPLGLAHIVNDVRDLLELMTEA